MSSGALIEGTPEDFYQTHHRSAWIIGAPQLAEVTHIGRCGHLHSVSTAKSSRSGVCGHASVNRSSVVVGRTAHCLKQQRPGSETGAAALPKFDAPINYRDSL